MSSLSKPTKPRGQATPVFRFKDSDRRNYDTQMRELHQGIPISKPDPSSPTNIAQIGDVGYMKNGEFHRLFNVLHKWRKEEPTKYKLDETVSKSNGIIASPGIADGIVYKAGSQWPKTFTVGSKCAGAVLFPVSDLRLESMGREGKEKMRTRMNDELGSWPCPESLARKDLLLVHSRLVVAKWVMMLVSTRTSEAKITVADGHLPTPSPSSSIPDSVVFETGNDITAILPSPDNAPTTLPSHCVFLGAFVPKVARLLSWDVEDVALDIETIVSKTTPVEQSATPKPSQQG